jgi:hypothetical protein
VSFIAALLLSLLESFLHVRWKPQFEGRALAGEAAPEAEA